jgi:hypothetical protein
MVDWRISRRQGACGVCGRAFEDGEPHFSALLVEGEELARRDACRACWRTGAGEGALFWWRTRHQEHKRRGLALNVEALEALFLSLEGRAEASLQELRYVLCLLLMRKRRLKIERVLRDGAGEAMLVHRPRRKESLRVQVFDFQPERIDELRTRLQEVFEGAELPSDTEGGDSGTDDTDTDAAPGELEREAS